MSQLDLFQELRPGMIAVMQSGARVAIWPCEGDDEKCFTGQLLEPGVSYARASGPNLSVFWDRSKIERVECATPDDQKLSLVELTVT